MGDRSPDDRLDSWKEIASHLRRTVRTVQRWERSDGLPVHRHLHAKGPSIFAYRSEVDAWWDTSRVAVDEHSETYGRIPPAAGARTILVLPLADLSETPASAHICDGIVEEVITALSKVSQFSLPSWTAVSGLLRSGSAAADLIDRFHVDLVVEGSVRIADDRVRVLLRLTPHAVSTVAWAESFEARLADLLVLEDRLITRLCEACGVDAMHHRLLRSHSEVLDAYHLYLMSRSYWATRSLDGMRQSIALATRALEHDPSYALAAAGLALAYISISSYTVEPPGPMMEQGRAAAQRALDLDDSLADAHSALGFVQLAYDWNLSAACGSLQRAMTLEPSNATAHQFAAIGELLQGRFDRAVQLCTTAERLDPASLILKSHTGWMLYFMRRSTDAIRHLEPTVRDHPQFWRGHFSLGWSYLYDGRHGDAVHSMEAAAELSQYPVMTAVLAAAYAKAGRVADAECLVTELLQSKTYASGYWLAVALVALRRFEEAMRWLWRAYDDREWYLVLAPYEPMLDTIREHDDFTALLGAVGLRTTRTGARVTRPNAQRRRGQP
jgi:serine/threonine-protein kinase